MHDPAYMLLLLDKLLAACMCARAGMHEHEPVCMLLHAAAAAVAAACVHACLRGCMFDRHAPCIS